MFALSMAVRSCLILVGTGTRGLVSMQAMEEVDIFSFQELCTDPCDMGLCIIMLKHEVMAADEWQEHSN